MELSDKNRICLGKDFFHNIFYVRLFQLIVALRVINHTIYARDFNLNNNALI